MVYLTKHQAEFIAASFSIEEISNTIDSLTGTTAPGLDGLTRIFYKAYKDILAPQLLEVYTEALEVGALPTSMQEAVISLLLKPGKDPAAYSSYCPISLINFDVKILVKMLSTRLSLFSRPTPLPSTIRVYTRALYSP